MGRARTGWLTRGALIGSALALRLIGLDRKSVWFDEAITYFDARSPWSSLLDSIRADVHPPLHYVLYHLWPLVDAGDFWFRLPSALLGGLAVAVAWVWARRIGSPLQALLTAALVAVAPLHIDLAQEARMYGLLLLLVATSLWLLDVVLVSPRRFSVGAYAIVCALLLYTHYYAPFVLAAHGCCALLAMRTVDLARGARWALIGLVAAGVCFVPWLPVLLAQAASIRGDYWIEPPSLSTLWVTFRALSAHTPPDAQFYLLLRVAYVAQAALLVFGAVLAWRSARARAAVLLGGLPIALAVLVSVVLAPVFAVRYVSPIGLGLAFLLVRGATALPRPFAVAAIAVGFLPALLSLGPLYTDPGYSRSDLRAAALAVQSARAADDVVIHLGAFSAAPFDYYRVAQPAAVLETNDRAELCQAMRGHPAAWLVTAYPTADDAARTSAEAGITSSSYAADLAREPPRRFEGVSVFRLSGACP